MIGTLPTGLFRIILQKTPAGFMAIYTKEGDEWNAAYWYSRASKPFPKYSLKEEWEEIYNALHTSI
ncbi:MAG: hypothetical protein R2764_16440 [Bacteroidales bacterium]